ncbi:uncharacterized protein BT62DRAFT_916476 [Guyanagaster necrorhizus]|uniref:Uncharacterized protein n=1 Tax=Guyanagaster necrorhizus TaxID=856835 RepID=A0A9P8AXL2_9AGAR|nr:uncharacterized protein BT62DRAFT_916476 [Guyanagaster necrorhizus MCA 3950]KAG7451475.1 hypothetical protein BT62DRAFT_916476 [Guyanagaster necrorhizus MCA 3950]
MDKVAPHKTKTPEIGLFWRKTKHDPVVAMNASDPASQKTPLMTDMNHDMMAVREDSPNTSSSQDGIALLGMPKYLVRKFIVHVAISSEFEFPWNGSEFGSVAQELGIQLADTDIRTLVLKGFSSGMSSSIQCIGMEIGMKLNISQDGEFGIPSDIGRIHKVIAILQRKMMVKNGEDDIWLGQ